jgi:YHS domain-containing protein/thiol-disulfide isomerase/thioredoxin
MRVKKISLVGLLFLTVTSMASAEGTIPWVYDLGEAQQLAQRDGRLVLLHFYADWCGPCRNLEQSVFPDLTLNRTLAANYVPVKINVDRNQELASRYGVRQIPTDVIIDAEGRVLHQTSSPSNAAQYVQLLNGLAASGAANPAVQTVSTQVAQPNQQSAPPQTAWESPWLRQDQPSASSNAYNPQPPTADSYGGAMARQDPSSQVAPLTSQAGPTAGGQSSWQPDRGGSMWQGGTAETTAPQSPIAPSPTSTGRGQVNPYASAPADHRPPSSYAPPATAAGEAWGGAPSDTANNAVAAETPQWNQQPRTPTGPVGGSVGNPYAQQSAAPAAPPTAPDASGTPPLALDGFCSVTLAEEEKWAKGDPAWGALHRGRTYLFRNQEQQQRFLADPDRYSPVLSGLDPTRYVDEGQAVAGLRQHGMWFRGKIYLFADEASLDQFSRNPEHYAQRSHEIMMAAGR